MPVRPTASVPWHRSAPKLSRCTQAGDAIYAGRLDCAFAPGGTHPGPLGPAEIAGRGGDGAVPAWGRSRPDQLRTRGALTAACGYPRHLYNRTLTKIPLN